MKKLLLIIIILCSVTVSSKASVLYSVNYDQKTVAAMVAAFGTETAAEVYYNEQVKKILDRYSAAEVAAAGIFASKYLDRKALTDLGLWSSKTENLLLSPHLQHGKCQDNAQNLDGGADDDSFSANSSLLGQLSNKDMHRDKSSVYAV